MLVKREYIGKRANKETGGPMHESNALVGMARAGQSRSDLQEIFQLGEVFARSGAFADTRSAAMAIVKILAGRELGFPAVASVVGIHIVEGKPVIGSHLLAAAIRSSGRYDFEILEHTDQVCRLRFKRKLGDNWKDLEPVECLTLEEAVSKGWTVTGAGKSKPTWKKTPKNMLFARCISNGYRFHCPDLFSALGFYVEDELEAADSLTPAFHQGEVLIGEASEGEATAQEVPQGPKSFVSKEVLDQIAFLIEQLHIPLEVVQTRLHVRYQVGSLDELSPLEAQEIVDSLRSKLAAKEGKNDESRQ